MNKRELNQLKQMKKHLGVAVSAFIEATNIRAQLLEQDGDQKEDVDC